MTADVFIDTNVFLYSLSDQPEEQPKAERARQILLNDNWGWSVQVAGEFYYVATSPKRQFQLSRSSATDYIETWLNFPTASLSSPRFATRFSWQIDSESVIGMRP